MNELRFASAHAEGRALEPALAEAANRALAGLDGDAPQLAFLFGSPHYGPALEDAVERIRELTGAAHVVGSMGAGVTATAGEFEQGPVVSLLLARLPEGARAVPTALRQDELLELEEPSALRARLGVETADAPSFVIFADPFTVEPDLLLARLEAAYPGAPAVGGLASGGAHPGAHVLFCGEHAMRAGVVVLALCGVSLRPVVSQGCRPVGRRFVVTKCDGNKILSLSGQPALVALHGALESLDADDRALARKNLLIGCAIREEQPEFARGDFLIRNFVGVVPDENAVVIGDRFRVGQTVQLQLRDRASAGEDLGILLDAAAVEGTPRAVLLVSCGGRGSRLFGEPHHDVRAVTDRFGDIPIAGFFASGEIGNVAHRNFVHGFTASLALF